MNEHIMPIPSRIYNAAVGGHVAGADQIIDDKTGLTLDKVSGGALEEKTYISGSDNGMGRVVLRKNLVNGVNTLTQSMINKSNTIYVIQYDFDLGGVTINIPDNSILKFSGGSFINGTLNGNNSVLNGNIKIDKISGTFKGNNIYSSDLSSIADFNKLKGLLSCGIDNVILDEDFNIDNFDSTIISYSNIIGKNVNISINCDIEKSGLLKPLIEFHNNRISGISIDFHNNAVSRVLKIRDYKEINIKDITIKNIDCTKYSNLYEGLVLIDCFTEKDCNINIENVTISNIKNIGNNIITDSNGNITGIYITGAEKIIANIKHVNFNELHNYNSNGDIILEDVSCIYVSQATKFNSKSNIIISNIRGYNFGKRLIKSDVYNINISNIEAESYSGDTLAVIGLNNGDKPNTPPENANVNNIHFKGIASDIISTAMKNTRIKNVSCEICNEYNKEFTTFAAIYVFDSADGVEVDSLNIKGGIMLCHSECSKKQEVRLNNITYNDLDTNISTHRHRLFLYRKSTSFIIKNANFKTNKIDKILNSDYEDNGECSFLFEDVNYEYSGNDGSLEVFNMITNNRFSSLKVLNCNFVFKTPIRRFIHTYANQKVELNNLNITFEQINTLTNLGEVVASNRNIIFNNINITIIKGDVENNLYNLFIKKDNTYDNPVIIANNLCGLDKVSLPSDIIIIGNYIPKIPDMSLLNFSLQHTGIMVNYNNKIYKWNGTHFIDIITGLPYNVNTYGNFDNKPTETNGINKGFAYFCTDKKSIEAESLGIVIYYSGNNVWIDALGRVVS